MARPARRILFIEKAFQIKFIAKVIAVVALGTALTGGFLYLFGNYQISRMYSSAHYNLQESWEVFRSAVIVASFLSMSLVAVLAVFFTIYDSHKIGGPLYRFRANLDQIGSGDLTLRTKLRDGDELKPFVDSINAMTESLKIKVNAIKESHEKMRSVIIEAKLKRDVEKLEELQRMADELSDKLAAFKVDM